MTTEDRINDEKLQYDINREAAKTSALSLGKIDKYEYFTGEEILPSNQRQIIERAKFTYSLLGKAFEKQTKTIEDQGKKQLDALADLKPIESKPIESKPIESKLIELKPVESKLIESKPIESKPKETKPKETKPKESKSDKYSNYFLNRLAKIQESREPIDFNNLVYYYKGNNAPTRFTFFNSPLNIFKSTYEGNKTLEEVEEEQIRFKGYLGDIKKGNAKKRSEKQKKNNR